jgi:Protein of unknown function (DUF2442)
MAEAEVTNVSAHGFWLLIGVKEMFVPFDEFPWFRDAPPGHIHNMRLQAPDHLYWPDLDIDLAVESTDHPERFPLVSKAGSTKALQPTGRAARPRRKRSARRAARG